MEFKNILVYLTHPHVDTWNFKTRHADHLKLRLPEIEVRVCANSAEFKDKLPEADAVLVWFFKKEWLEKFTQLKLIATPAAGNDWISWEPPENIKLSFGGFHGPMIAESVIGALFYFIKAFPLSMTMREKKKWARIKISEKLQSLYKARVTILGFGRIGDAIGKLLKPFGCDITGVKRSEINPPDYFGERDKVVTLEKLDSVLPETDHLICALPGGEGTDEILKPSHFKILPKTSFLYNIGRGNIYKESDLVEALQNREIAGAYLDVFGEEPLQEASALWEMDHVLIQPHLSAASPQYLDLFVEELADRINKGEFD